MKKMIMAAVAIGFSLAMTMTAWAGTWKQDGNGWWYENDNGRYQNDGWFQDPADSQWYFASNSGYILQNTWMGNYYLGASGAMLTNTTTPDGYKVGADGAWIQDNNTNDLYGKYYSEYNNTDHDKYFYDAYITLYKNYTDYIDGKTYNDVIELDEQSYYRGHQAYALFSINGSTITKIKDLDELNIDSDERYTSGKINADGSITFYSSVNSSWDKKNYETYYKE